MLRLQEDNLFMPSNMLSETGHNAIPVKERVGTMKWSFLSVQGESNCMACLKQKMLLFFSWIFTQIPHGLLHEQNILILVLRSNLLPNCSKKRVWAGSTALLEVQVYSQHRWCFPVSPSIGFCGFLSNH